MPPSSKRVMRRPWQQAVAGTSCLLLGATMLAAATEETNPVGRAAWLIVSALAVYLGFRAPFLRITASASGLRVHNWFWGAEIGWAEISGFRPPKGRGWPHQLGLRVQLVNGTYRYASAFVMTDLDDPAFADGILVELERLRIGYRTSR